MGDGASIGSGGYSSNGNTTGTPVKGEEIELDLSDMTGGFVARIDGKTESGHTHNWKEISRVAATQDSAGEVEYFCKGCGSTSVKILPVMQPAAEENSSDAAIVLTVTAAPTYEMYLENARYIVTADSDTAILSGRLGNLADLKAQGADTLASVPRAARRRWTSTPCCRWVWRTPSSLSPTVAALPPSPSAGSSITNCCKTAEQTALVRFKNNRKIG